MRQAALDRYYKKKDEIRAYNREYRSRPESKAKERARHLNKRYGITMEEYDGLRKMQGDRCAICAGQPTGRGVFHVDHDHHTGKVRGLLCHDCNVGIGHFKDNPNLMEKAAIYVRSHSE